MKTLKALLLSTTIILTPATTYAAMAVVDTPAIGKLIDQLNKMQEQITLLGDMKNLTQDQLDAIGALGQITLPFLNSAKLGSQIAQDLQCLKPDLSKLMPNVEFDSLDWKSVCQGGSAYRSSLWLDKENLVSIPWTEQVKLSRAVEERRENVLSDATEKGMALADVATSEVEKTSKAADEIEAAAKSAKTENDRLAVIAESQAALLRSSARQTQLLAQMLKVQSAFALKAGVPVESLLSEGDDKKKEGGQ